MNAENVLEYFAKEGDGSHAIAYTYTGRYMEWKIKHFALRSFTKETKRCSGRPLKILDIGCGRGDFIFDLSNVFPDYYFVGIDIKPHCIYYANKRAVFRQNKRVDFFVGDAEHINFHDKSFDVIIATEILEHLSNPKNAIKEMHRLLNDNGVAIVSVPNGNNLLESSFMKGIKRLISNGIIFKPKNNINIIKEQNEFSLGHVSLFNRQKWMRLFEEQSLRVEQCRRGALFWGGNWIDNHRILFALCLLLDVIFDKLPIFNDVTENCLFTLRKKA